MPVIEVEHLHKQYRDQVAVDDLSFTVERGEIFGILGPNGAGKTTTVEIIEGLRTPDGGTVRVLGLDPQRDRTELRRRVGAQLQESELPEQLKVWEAMELYSSFYDRPADWERLLEDLGLADKRDTRYGKLSGGQKQRLSIALALVGNPELAILDELTSGLDPNARRDTWELIDQIRDRGVTVVLVTHFMEEAERLADRVAVIDGGRLVAIDSPAGLVSRIDAEQRLRFRPSVPLDDRLLTDLPEVREVTRRGSWVLVTGTGDLLQAVTAVLARNHIVAADLRAEQATGSERSLGTGVGILGRRLLNVCVKFSEDEVASGVRSTSADTLSDQPLLEWPAGREADWTSAQRTAAVGLTDRGSLVGFALVADRPLRLADDGGSGTRRSEAGLTGVPSLKFAKRWQS